MVQTVLQFQPATKLIVFDVDGTLVDSQASIVITMYEAFDRCRVERPTPEAIRRMVGLSLQGAITDLLEPDLKHRAGEIADAYRAAFVTRRDRGQQVDQLFPGAREIIDALDRAGFILGLATGKSARGVDAMLDAYGFDDRFATIQTADFHPSKPHPSMLLTAAAETGVEMSETLMIGDTTFDIDMARAAGARALGVAWGNHRPDELLAAGALAVLSSFEEIHDHLLPPGAKGS